jgi:hypothetical protein
MAKKRGKARNMRFGKRLISYSMAAGATLALAQPAGADVVYSGPKNLPVSMGETVYVDLNGDSSNDVMFTAKSSVPSHYVKMDPLCANSALKLAPPSYFRRLSGGYPIGEGAAFWESMQGFLQLQLSGGSTAGNFIDKTGYIGVRVKVDDEFDYCWIHYRGSGFSNGTIIDWACESQGGVLVRAGDTGAQPEPVPTLNQWGIMILAGLILAGGARRLKRQLQD